MTKIAAPPPQDASAPTPPRARALPTRRSRFGITWDDPYAWLRDPAYPAVENPEILAYLAAENVYAEAVMAPQKELIRRLHAELKGRIKEDDSSVPVPEHGFAYHWRFFEGAQYRTWFRRPLDQAMPQVILDENEIAAGRGYFALRTLEPSPDGRLLAYTSDEDGSERFGLHLKDLTDGRTLADLVTNTSGAVEWAEDGLTLHYVELNDKLRPFRVKAHRLGTDPAEDVTLYEESDPAFFVSLSKTLSRRFVVIRSGTHVTTEVRLIDALAPLAAPLLVAARRDGHRYGLDHAHGRLWILTNDMHENFRLVSAPEAAPDPVRWRQEITGSETHYLLQITCFEDFMVLRERARGLSHLRVRDYGGREHVIEFPEPAYTASLGDNREFAADTIRVSYSSMVTPPSVLEYDVRARRLRTLKVQEIPSGYEKEHYVTRRLLAPARDGAEIPITIVHRADFPPAGGGPLMLYGYGAYGHGLDPAFASSRLSLLDRGIAFALAHVRGGDELGWRWYETGKGAHKRNTFDDFIACADYLVREGYTRAGAIAARGGSAGGMLVGAVVNARPELFRCVVAEVPFVDVLNTMLDEGLPLTPIEWPEWGDPVRDADAFRLIMSYSPYDNIRAQAYPAMLVTAGISDPRVTYWEPAKYVARLRATRTDNHLLLLRTNMDAGHFGRSGRYDALTELALQHAFVLRCFGQDEEPEPSADRSS